VSADAVRYVKTWIHPKATRSVHAFYDAIAERIPEGQTTTPPLTLDELAAASRQVERTARTNRDFLVDVHQVKVHDGGQGRKDARYEMLQLTGERPIIAAPLPLIGRPKPPKPSKAKGQWRTSDLFAEVTDHTSANFAEVTDRTSANFTEVATKVGSFCRCWFTPRIFLPKFVTIVVSIVSNLGKFCRGALPLDVDDADSATTTYVRSKNDPDPDRGAERVVVDARAREPADDFLDWFEQTYPTVHQGAVCQVPRARHGPLVRQLLDRPRHDVAHLQEMTRLMWAITDDGVFKSNYWWIATQVTVRDVFVLHRKANFLDLEVRRREAAAAQALTAKEQARHSVREPPMVDAVWTEVLHQIAQRVNPQAMTRWFADTTLLRDGGDVIFIAAPADRLTWLSCHYRAVVDEAVQEVRPGARVEFVAEAGRGAVATG